jgi:hypothetical protein
MKPKSTRNSSSSWINMVVNFNLTWKSSCLEILHYVGSKLLFGAGGADSESDCSLLNELLAHSWKNERHLWSGVSGLVPKTMIVLIVSGLVVKLPKRRITYLTGKHTPVHSINRPRFLIILNSSYQPGRTLRSPYRPWDEQLSRLA